MEITNNQTDNFSSSKSNSEVSETVGSAVSSKSFEGKDIQNEHGEQSRPKIQWKWRLAGAVNTSAEMKSEVLESTGPDAKQTHREFGSSWRDKTVQLPSRSSNVLPVNTRADALRSISYGQARSKNYSRNWKTRQKVTRSDQADWRSHTDVGSSEILDMDILPDLAEEHTCIIQDGILPNIENVLMDENMSKFARKERSSSIEDKRIKLTNEFKKQRESSQDIIQTEKRSGKKSKLKQTISPNNLIEKDPKALLIELTKSDVALKDCIGKSSEDNDFLKQFLDSLARAFSCDTIPHAMIMLFETLKENRYFDTLVLFLIDLQDRVTKTAEVIKHEKVLKDILKIVVSQITRNLSSVTTFSRTYTVLVQVVNEMKALENYVLDEEIQEQFTMFSERKKEAENMLKSYSKGKDKNQPPEDFRIIQVTPGPNEIRGGVQPFLRANKIEGEYEDLEHYLDVQFRLLREDFVGPLREGICEYIKTTVVKDTGKDEKKLRSDIQIYNARVHSPVITEHGFCYKMKLEMTPHLRKLNWSVSKRLIYGSLVCLTEDEFTTFTLAIVVGRDEEDIKRGIFTIQLDGNNTPDMLHRIFKIAETSAYFESYKHVLKGLQEIRTVICRSKNTLSVAKIKLITRRTLLPRLLMTFGL